MSITVGELLDRIEDLIKTGEITEDSVVHDGEGIAVEDVYADDNDLMIDSGL